MSLLLWFAGICLVAAAVLLGYQYRASLRQAWDRVSSSIVLTLTSIFLLLCIALGIFPFVETVLLSLLLLCVAIGYLLEQKQWGPDTSVLAQKTPREIRDIAWRYQLRVTGKAGNTWERITFFGGCYLFMVYALYLLDTVTGSLLPFGLRWTLVLGLPSLAMLLLLPWFMVKVPKIAAVITENFFTGRMHTFTPGFNIRYPWELFHRRLDLLSQRGGQVQKESVFLSKDGVQVQFGNWEVQWGPFLPLLPLNIRYASQDTDKETEEANVSATISEIVENTLFQEVLSRTVEEIRTPDVVDEIETELINALQQGGHQKRDKFGSTIEERNGVVIEIAALGPLSFSEDYEQSLVASKVINKMREDAKQMKDDLHLEGSQALDSVMIANKEGVTRQIFKVEMDQKTSDAVQDLGAGISKGLGGIAQALPKGRPAPRTQKPKGGSA